MKKIIAFVMPIILFISIFMGINLKSYAIATVDPHVNGFTSGVCRYDFALGSTVYKVTYDINENSAYNRYGMCCYFVSEPSNGIERWCFCNVFDLLNGINNTSEPFAYVDYSTIRVSDNHVDSQENQTWTSFDPDYFGWIINIQTGMIYTTDFPVFANKEKCIDYYRYSLFDDESIRYGEQYLNDSTFNDIVYDPLEIPAPNVEWVADSNGNFTHELHFLNNGYFGEHNTQLNYGLILSMHWISVNKASIALYQDQGAYTRYQFTANDFCLSDEVEVYSNPTTPFNFNDYKCPPYLNLDTNGLCINGFNQMLSAYPISGREFISSSNQNNANFVLNTVKDHLDEINYKLNCPIVSCQYFVINEDNKLVKGPITKVRIKYPNPCYFNGTGSELGYEQSEIQTWNPETDTPLTDQSTINPPSAPKPGVVDPYEVPNYTKADPSQLVDNMTGLFGLVGQMPSFVAQLISFLPDWILQFIAVSLGLAIVIGIVKLFIG